MRPFVSLVVVSVFTAACGDSYTPTKPTQTGQPPAPAPPQSSALTVTAVAPTAGWPLYFTQISGSGFTAGTRVTFDGLQPQFIDDSQTELLKFAAPMHAPGPVDVVVTRPDGQSVTLRGGFTYKAATIELSTANVTAGETIAMSWAGPHDPSDFVLDLIALYRVGDATNTKLWWINPGIPGTGTMQVKTPSTPGEYEFRYLLFDQHLLVTVPLTLR